MPKSRIDEHNYLNINELPPPIDGGNENDFAYSLSLAKLLRRFVRIAVPDHDDLTMSDVELLEAIIRYGSQKRVAELMHVSPSNVSTRLSRILPLLDARVTQWEDAQAYIDQSDRIAELESQLAKARQQIIKASREKPLAVEAQLREHTRGCPTP